MAVIYEITQHGRELCDDPAMWEGISPEAREILLKTLDDMFGKKYQRRKYPALKILIQPRGDKYED
jgi:hypothetical protein